MTTAIPGYGDWADEPADTASARTFHLTLAGAVAAAASVGAGLVHAGAAGSHSGERKLALLFAVTAAVQLAVGALGAFHPRRISYLAIVGVNVAAVAAWVVSRTTGTSILPELAEREKVGFPDLTAAILGGLAVVAALGVSLLVRRPRAVAPAWAALAGVAVLVASVPAMAAPHDHDHVGGEESVAAADGHDHTHGDGTTATTTKTDPNFVLGVQLPDVPGVTQEQKVRAATLINDTRTALAKYPTTGAAEAAGFRSIGDGFTGFEHFVNAQYLINANTLDPDEPESLVFKVNPDGTKILGSAMYILPPGKTMADIPDVAGAMTQWHDHQNLCWDASGLRLAGRLVDGQCRPGGTFRATPPMLHVWIIEQDCGPFAGIEGSAHTGACNSVHSH